MAKEKKQLPPTERLKVLKKKKNALFLAEIGCAVAPFGVLTAINFKEYFIQTPAWRTSLSFIMLMVSTLISVAIITKDKLKINYLNALIMLAVVDGILWFMGNLILDLAYILLFVIFGFIGALICELKKKGEVEAIQEIEEGIKKAKTDIIADEFKEEQETIKVKIKK